jgi:DNA-binding transcriptional LysR family regulator
MLDTWALRVLVTVADLGSFSAAAGSLSMTQPAVSRQIGGLERRLGVRLFTRVPRGVRLTTAGQVAVELARDGLARLDLLEARMASFTELATGTLRLCAFPSANAYLMPEAIRRFSAAHPGVSLTLLPADPQGALAAVREGRIDLALVTDWHLYQDPETAKGAPTDADPPRVDADGVDLLPLLDEALLLALAVDHPLARRPRVRLADLAGEAWIEGAFPDCLGPLGPLTDALGGPPRIGFWCDDWNGKQAFVAAGAGVMLVPDLARPSLRRDIVVRPVTPRLPTRRLYAATPATPVRTPAAGVMLTVLAELAGPASTGAAPAPRRM